MERRNKTGSTNLPLLLLVRRQMQGNVAAGNYVSTLNLVDNWAQRSPGTEMSGGERKKKIARGTGWEEAGGEFYQESYPGAELDLEALPRDPHYFATLLPSKQTRAATTRKPTKVDNKATYRRRTSTRQRSSNTMGHNNTMPNDTHVAMMPDLSENLSNEETTWEEMMLIKAMPVSMSQKREIKAKLLSADTFRLQGMRRLKWRRRKLWDYLKVRWKEFHKKLELWGDSFQTIEGRFGPAVSSFFVFVKWLMILNCATAALVVSFTVVPASVIEEQPEECTVSNSSGTSVACCSQLYVANDTSSFPTFFEMVEGTGWIERSHLFYGAYPNTALRNDAVFYNLPVAYIATFIAMFLLCSYWILRSGTASFKERLVEGEGQYYKFCSLVFSGWDFCVHTDKAASAKHKALFLEMKEWIEKERRADDKKHRTRDECCRSLLLRISIHLLNKLIFVAASSLIYFTIQFSQNELSDDNHSDEYRLLLEYAPSLCIVGVNLVVPNVMHHLVTLEGYSPANTVRVMLLRNLLTRLSALLILLSSIRSLVQCGPQLEGDCTSPSCRTPLCWETFAGRQIYKLLLLDTVVQIVLTFLVNFPRMLMAKHINCKLARYLGSQEFDLMKHLVDVVYIQLLVWLGGYFMPLLPAIATVLLFITFYMKKFACVVNSSPSSTTVYRVTKSKSTYLLVLAGAFVTAAVLLGYSIVTMQPSRSCGPFRGLPTAWSLVETTYNSSPAWFRSTIAVTTSSTIAVPTVVLLLLLFYYYYTLTTENRQMVVVLKKQLVLEGHDKQFLLNRLSAFIKQHQERHKAARSIDPPPANSA